MRLQFASVLLCLITNTALVAQDASPSDVPSETNTESSEASAAALIPELLGAFKFRSIGPSLMSGRISDIALDNSNPNVWYIAVGSGGVWKTTNAGTTFEPIFDSQPSYSIGCVTIDPSRSDTIWVGTGENVGGRHVGFGDGIYRSKDGGKSFENLGLAQSERISKIVVDLRNSETVYVAVQGPLWSPGGERGLFKTTDGGATWTNILSKGPYTGVTDVVIDPKNPNVIYAATHQRHRTVWALLNTGPESGVFKSTDGGLNWSELKNGIPGGDKGKIALGVSPQNSQVVYASIETVNREGGFFRSSNGGESWEKQSDFVSGGTGPHYYQEIYLDPHRFDVIYHANNTLVRSIDGGKTFEPIEGETKHVDNHAVVFHPNDKDFLLVGCDGGVYRSNDFGATYSFFGNLPLTQFYKVDVDYDLPFYNVVGGTQDNNSQYGPSATRFVQGITNADWQITIGGDGHDNAIDPTDPNIIYCESQQGMIARFDRKTGESISIRPQPAAGEEDLRFNWDSPILISPHDPKRIYFASKKLHRSDDRGDSWTTISPDLSKGTDRWKLPVMGRVWGIDAGFDLMAMSAYGNITSVSESPVVAGLLYVGTDDGLIQVSEDSGATWRKIERFFDVPEGAFVNDLKADRHDANTVYACLDHHKTGDFKPYVIKSTDRGVTWTIISADLPDRHLVWRIEQDHVKPNLLFLGTEFGVFCSLDSGGKWHKFSSGMPTIPVRDLAIQKRENDLVCATFGRGFYVLDDYSALRDLEPAALDKPAHLFSSRRSWWYSQADKLGGRKGFQGDSFFTSDNPTFGAVFTVHIKDSFKSRKSIREEAEQAAKKENKDASIPTLEELENEKNELSPSRYIHITDASDAFVARVTLPNEKGLHRVAWDFRKAPFPGSRFRPIAFPGNYKAIVMEWDGKETKKLSESITFATEPLQTPSLPPVAPKDVEEFQKALLLQQKRLTSASRKLARATKILNEAKTIVTDSLPEPSQLLGEIQTLELEKIKFEKMMFGSPILSERYIEQVPTASDRLNGVIFGDFGSTHGPTKTHREQLEIVKTELDVQVPKIDQFASEQIDGFRKKLEGMGIELAIDP